MYSWASNQIKLARARKTLEDRKKIDPTVVVDENSIKAMYIQYGGLVLSEEQVVQKEVKKAKKK